MRFVDALIPGVLLRRYQRFLADVRLADGSLVTAHCPNSGSMRTCAEPGWRVRLSRNDAPGRRLHYTWEMVHNGQGWIGVNTGWPPKVAEEAIAAGSVPELAGYPVRRREVPYGTRSSRIDLLLEDGPRRCYVEVKNVTLLAADGAVAFPDAVTERGLKHLLELADVVRAGGRGVMLYVVQRADGAWFRPAVEIDPAYAETLAAAEAAGVEVLVYRAAVSPRGIRLADPVPRHPPAGNRRSRCSRPATAGTRGRRR
jgi:sugar fermentation stimulation protein A